MGRWCVYVIVMAKRTKNSNEVSAQVEARFLEIYREYDSLIRRICFGYASCGEEMMDLYQDSLVNIWQGLEKFRGECSVKTWIYRVTLNTCVSSFRRKSRMGTTVALDEFVDLSDADDEKKETIKELYECISQLNAVDKAIVMLWLDEYSYEEIGELTGLTRNNVAQRLHRAKDRLKNIFPNIF